MASGARTDSADSGTERRVAELVEEFSARQEKGEHLDVESFVARLPEAADDLRDALEGLVALRSSGSAELSSSADLPGLSSGVELGGFRIERELGRGGMGVVYEAVDLTLSRRVALKLLPPLAGLDPNFRERFRREARAAAKLRHPNIVPVHGEGQGNGLDFFVMQCIDGESLAQLVRRARDGSRADVPELGFLDIARIGERIADALGHAHASGVLHRDVKPGNVLIDADGHVWVTDFGLAKSEGTEGLTMSGALVGTLNYMAPEQVEGTSDVRSDVYGLGATLYELVTLRKPFDDTSRSGLVRRVLNDEPMRPRRLVPDVPRDLESILLKAMAKLPEHRYGTAAAMADDLRAFSQSRPVSARPPGLLYLARLAWRRQRLALSVVAAVLVVLPILGLLYLRSMNEVRLEQRHRLYLTEIAAAEAARLEDAGAAREHLERAPAEHRDWEWRHLSASVDQSLGIVAALPRSPFQSLASSPDGRRIAVGDKRLLLIEDGGEPVELKKFNDYVYSLAFDATGERLAAYVGTCELVVWDLSAEPRIVASRITEGTHGLAVAFSPDGRYLVTGDYYSRAAIVDAQDLETVHLLGGHGGYVGGTAFSPDGRRAYTAGADATIREWNVETGRGRVLYRGSTGIKALAVGPTGKRVALGTEVGTVGVVDVESGVLAWSSGAFDMDVTAVAFAGRGGYVVSSSQDRNLALHDAETGLYLRTMVGHTAPVNDLGVCADGVSVYSVDWGGTIRAWDVEASGGSVDLFGCLDDVSMLAFSDDGRRLASAGRDGVVRVWNPQTATITHRGAGHRSGPVALAWPDADRLVSVGISGDAIRWHLSGSGALELERESTLDVQGNYVRQAALAGRERERIWVAVRNLGLIVLNDELTTEATLDIPGLTYMDVSPDRRTVLAVDATGRVHRIDADRRELGLSFSTGSLLDEGASLAGEGESIATLGTEEFAIRLWSSADGTAQDTIEMGERVTPFYPGTLRNGPSRDRLLYSAFSRGITLWDPFESEFVLRLRGIELYISAPAVDSERIACGDAEGLIRVWDAISARERHELLEEERRSTGRLVKGASQRLREEYAWVLDQVQQRLAAGTERADWLAARTMAFGLSRIDGGDPAPPVALGDAYLRLAYPDEAARFLRRAVTLHEAAGTPAEEARLLLEQVQEAIEATREEKVDG